MHRFPARRLSLIQDGIALITTRRHRMFLGLCLALCSNLVIAPALYAATGSISRSHAYAMGLLGIVVVGLALYLGVVILKPERF